MTTLYTEKHKVSYDTVGHITDEYIKRTILHKLIDHIPIEDLLKIFKIEVLNPVSKESERLLNDPTGPMHIKEHIRINREYLTLEYEASIKI